MSIKNHGLLVSLSVLKPQLTKKDSKATADAESANNAQGAGQYRKDLYPKHLIAPINQVESSARAYIESQTYPWRRGEYLLPTARFMEFSDRMGKFELEFSQAVTAFLNNWANVMAQAQAAQGSLYDASEYPDVSALRGDFRWQLAFNTITDMSDFRVAMQADEMDILAKTVEETTKQSMANLVAEPLRRLRERINMLVEVTSKGDRQVVNAKGVTETKAPIFRDSIVEKLMDEIALLREFADILPDHVVAMADAISITVPHAQTLRDDPEKRKEVNTTSAGLLAAIDDMLEN